MAVTTGTTTGTTSSSAEQKKGAGGSNGGVGQGGSGSASGSTASKSTSAPSSSQSSASGKTDKESTQSTAPGKTDKETTPAGKTSTSGLTSSASAAKTQQMKDDYSAYGQGQQAMRSATVGKAAAAPSAKVTDPSRSSLTSAPGKTDKQVAASAPTSAPGKTDKALTPSPSGTATAWGGPTAAPKAAAGKTDKVAPQTVAAGKVNKEATPQVARPAPDNGLVAPSRTTSVDSLMRGIGINPGTTTAAMNATPGLTANTPMPNSGMAFGDPLQSGMMAPAPQQTSILGNQPTAPSLSQAVAMDPISYMGPRAGITPSTPSRQPDLGIADTLAAMGDLPQRAAQDSLLSSYAPAKIKGSVALAQAPQNPNLGYGGFNPAADGQMAAVDQGLVGAINAAAAAPAPQTPMRASIPGDPAAPMPGAIPSPASMGMLGQAAPVSPMTGASPVSMIDAARQAAFDKIKAARGQMTPAAMDSIFNPSGTATAWGGPAVTPQTVAPGKGDLGSPQVSAPGKGDLVSPQTVAPGRADMVTPQTVAPGRADAQAVAPSSPQVAAPGKTDAEAILGVEDVPADKPYPFSQYASDSLPPGYRDKYLNSAPPANVASPTPPASPKAGPKASTKKGSTAPSQEGDYPPDENPVQTVGQPQTLRELYNRYQYEKAQAKQGLKDLPGKLLNAIVHGDIRGYTGQVNDKRDWPYSGGRGGSSMSSGGGSLAPSTEQQVINQLLAMIQQQQQGGIPSQMDLVNSTFI